MSTRSATHFVENGENYATVYRHYDGYPEGHGAELQEFFSDVEAQTADHRYTDPSYLAAKLVVWLADRFTSGPHNAKAEMLDFLGVGIMLTDPGDIEFLYEIDCGEMGADGRPLVRCYEMRGFGEKLERGKEVPIPVPA